MLGGLWRAPSLTCPPSASCSRSLGSDDESASDGEEQMGSEESEEEPFEAPSRRKSRASISSGRSIATTSASRRSSVPDSEASMQDEGEEEHGVLFGESPATHAPARPPASACQPGL